MKTITYTYDETRCTNKDYLILELTESIDDGGAGYESVAEYNINCPYSHSSDCLNNHEGNQYDSKEYREGCVRCKLAWLEREYDTYPSEDGKWEVETGARMIILDYIFCFIIKQLPPCKLERWMIRQLVTWIRR